MVMDMNGRSHRPAGLPQGTAGTYEPTGDAGGDDDLSLENARMVQAETHSNPPASYGNLKPDWRRSDDWMGRGLYDDKAHASIHVGRNNTVSDERLEAAARMAEPVSAAGYQVDVSDGCVIIAADGRRGIFNLDTGDMSVYRGGDEDALLEFEARPGENGFAKGDDRHVDAMLDRLAGNRIASDALRDLVNAAMSLRSPRSPDHADRNMGFSCRYSIPGNTHLGSFRSACASKQTGKQTQGVSTFGPAHGHLPIPFQPPDGKHAEKH